MEARPRLHEDAQLDAVLFELSRYRSMAERAMAQLDDAALREALSRETNSIAVIVKHLSGNFRSRFTDFLTADGEKPWRDRDAEFVDDFADRRAIEGAWERGWACALGAIKGLTSADLGKMVTIRSEVHSVPAALARATAHAAYHTGQIVMIARILSERRGEEWKTLTIPRGGTKEFNERMGHPPA
ncbi:MAG: DUF1572 family protein [Planctomycetota bacterium]|nr:DUF1572 family protein [Planctomycetota bacterium]